MKSQCVCFKWVCFLPLSSYYVYTTGMKKDTIAHGVVHKVPEDLRGAISDSKVLQTAWEDITPLARNEWICWIESAKKEETRAHRIQRARAQLLEGKRRPCCWAGCPHR